MHVVSGACPTIISIAYLRHTHMHTHVHAHAPAHTRTRMHTHTGSSAVKQMVVDNERRILYALLDDDSIQV